MAISQRPRFNLAAPSATIDQHRSQFQQTAINNTVPIDPPADRPQYSNRPSKTGQSSPTLTAPDQSVFHPYKNIHHIDPNLTLCLLFAQGFHVIGRNARQKVNIFVGVELSHFPLVGWLRSLRGQKLDADKLQRQRFTSELIHA